MEAQRKALSFKGQNIYIGIDVHLKSWSVTLMSEATQLKRFSQSPDPDALYAHLVRNYPEAEYHSVYEAGFCGFWIHYRLVGLGIHNIVVNPADVPTTTSEKLRKTDAVDSAKLARSLRAGELKGIYVPGSESLETRSLIRLRDSITKDQTRLKNRIKSHLRYLGIEIPEEFSGPGRCWNRRFVVWLKGAETGTAYGRQTLDFLVRQYEALRGQRLEMLRAVRALSRTERFEKPLENLMTVPGIGQLTGMSLLSEIDDIRRFKSADQLAAFIGMIPMCHSSGEREGVGDMTVRRSARLRSVLVEASWVAVRQDPALSMAYGNYCKRMAPGHLERTASSSMPSAAAIRQTLSSTRPWPASISDEVSVTPPHWNAYLTASRRDGWLSLTARK